MIVLLNGTSPDLLESVATALRGLDWPLGDGQAPEIRTGVWLDPAPLRRLRAELAERDPESQLPFRLREEGSAASASQDAAAHRGDVGFVIAAPGGGAPTLALEIADVLLEEVSLQEPRADWRERFEREAALLTTALSPRTLAIHHIGSTAIPDVPAKPIVDLLVELPSLADFPSYLEPLAGLGYSFLDYPQNRDRRFLRKGRPRTHHLHVVETGSQEARDHLDFRDALLADEDLRRDYADLKRGLAGRHGRARAAYGEGKSAFIAESLRRWRSHGGDCSP